jgi:perosamine synthetase
VIDQIHPVYGEDEVSAITDYLRCNKWLTEHKETAAFEEDVANYLGVRYCVAVTSGTVGLYVALLACGIQPGDIVLVPGLTMIATANAVRWAYALPTLVDIRSDDFTMDVLSCYPPKYCKAVLYVPLNGRSGDIKSIVQYCKAKDLILIEDACQAFGSCVDGQYLGTFGLVGVYSLTPHKIITTGQGGLVVTNNKVIYERIRQIKDFGRSAPGVDWHTSMGYNFKFTDLQAVLGRTQLKSIEWRKAKKRQIFETYAKNLTKKVTIAPMNKEEVPWFVDILCPTEMLRDKLINHLKGFEISSRSFYPPIHKQPVYFDSKTCLPVAENIAPRGLWLPSSLDLTEEQILFVCTKINEFFES